MKKYLVFISLFFISGISSAAIAEIQTSETHWDRSSAMAAVQSVDITEAVHELGNISTLADGQSTLDQLKQLENRADWPLPAREAALYRFTRSLVDLPRDAVSPAVLRHLRTYQAQTLVPHDEHESAFIPLFNIRAAAAGVESSWQRQEFAFEAETLIGTDPEALVSGYGKATSPNQRYAYIDLLKNARLDEVYAVQDAALTKLDGSPALTPVIATTATITKDPIAIQQLLTDGQGMGISPALVSIGQQLSSSEIGRLLIFAIRQAPAINASMAMAAWSPLVQHQVDVRDLLVETLADPGLGSSAALALAHQPDIQTIKILQETAAGDSAAAQRAQMALDLNRDRLIGERQP
jgi:hypothetical protein